MIVRPLSEAPSAEVAAALEVFEREFTYPLGARQRFRISHGLDYPRFYRAIGGSNAATFTATGADGRIRGTLGAAVRPVQLPGGECATAAYLGDLKTSVLPGRGRILLKLAAEATTWCLARGATFAYGVVMDGTSQLPADYTGQLGVRAFRKVSEISILRIPVPRHAAGVNGVERTGMTEIEEIEDCFQQRSRGRFAPLGGNSALRSEIEPIALIATDGSSCGIIEDTRCAKRLLVENGEELRFAHLSKFAYAAPTAGAQLLRAALHHCASNALAPSLFTAVPTADLRAFMASLGDGSGCSIAPASIYAAELGEPFADWNISTSEI